MTKPAIIANMAYISTKRSGRGTGAQGLQSKLKYFQYRDDRNGHIAQEEEVRRWYDRGLGKSYGAIFKNCLAEQSQTVAAWTWVVSPSPTLMALVPEDQRHDLVAQLTDEVVEAYYEARDLPQPDYSFVLHDRDTKGGQQQVHAHVVLTGMVYDEQDQKATPVFNAKNKGHMKLFDEIANRELATLLDRSIGPEWRLQLEEPPEPTIEAILAADLVEHLASPTTLESPQQATTSLHREVNDPALTSPKPATIGEPDVPTPTVWQGPSMEL